MRKLLACLLFVASSALAEGVLKNTDGSVVIVFKDTQCVHEKVAPMILPEYLPLFKTAGVLYKEQGRMAHACWAANPDAPDEIHLLTENGEVAVIPRRAIKWDQEA